MKAKYVRIWVLCIVVHSANLFAESRGFVFDAPRTNGVNNLGSRGGISIGDIRREGDFRDPISRWHEYAYVSNTNIINALNSLMEIGSTNLNLASLSGTCFRVLFLDDKGEPQKIASISRANSWIRISSCRRNELDNIVCGDETWCQSNPAWVGLVYGILVRYNFEAIRAERDIFDSKREFKTFEGFLFSEMTSKSFEDAYNLTTNTVHHKAEVLDSRDIFIHRDAGSQLQNK